jgi:glycine/D-amino acid oxidase-like deaminating enzyme/nitrite reductase/ring-hydroxylating ferredoxin subunit
MLSETDTTESLWMYTAKPPRFPGLAEDLRTQVCVVGGGIAGLTTAYLLTRAGKAVVLVDDGGVASGETGRTTAHLTAALDTRYADLIRLHGDERTRMAAESHLAAIQRIESIVSLEDIECDFERVDGFLILDQKSKHALLDRELTAVRQMGMADAALFERAPLDTFDSGVTLRFPRQAQFHPLKYVQGLVRAIVRDGGAIYGETKVIDINDGEPATVKTSMGHTIVADDVVVATHSPVNDWMVMHTKLAPYRTYVIGMQIPKESVPLLLLWDTGNPYHYVRVQPGSGDDASHDILIVGGEDHKTGQAEDTNDRFHRLEAWTRARFPMAEAMVFQWSGQVLEPVDGLGYIGKNPGADQHIYIITGDSGNGMTNGTLGGMLITDLITGRENPWTVLYDPSRITLRSAAEFARENLNVAEQYAQYLTPGDVTDTDAIEPGSGAVIRRGIHKIAVYKDESGALTECSAVCPHLYCIVDWNETERSWDCPCHGSRFDRFGKVISGPAIDDLDPPPHVVKAQ